MGYGTIFFYTELQLRNGNISFLEPKRYSRPRGRLFPAWRRPVNKDAAPLLKKSNDDPR